MATQTDMQNWIAKWLANQGLTKEFSIKQLAGDGSTRTFYRISLSDVSYILLWDPDWTLSQDYPEHQSFLHSHGIAVPEFFACDAKAGALLMEDLGDDLLQHKIQAQPNRKIEWIRKSVLLLANLHGSTYPVPHHLPCAKRRFDKEKYLQELLFTQEHLSHKLLGEAPLKEVKVLAAFAKNLESIEPVCFSHRDYHTRNILPKKEELVLIDFQDARLGPPHYDLASILYDAYMPLQESERKSLTTDYVSALKKFDLYGYINWETFDTDLKLVALQRTIKAAGSFASFYTRNGKSTHLPYLKPALEMALSLKQSISELPHGFDSSFPLENWIRKTEALKVK